MVSKSGDNVNVTISLLLFDDLPPSEFENNLRQSRLNIEPETCSFEGKNPFTVLEDRLGKGSCPDIVFMDYVLNKTADSSKTLLQNGASLVPLIRGQWPRVPVFAYTQAPDECKADVSKRVFEEIFNKSNLADLIPFIPSIAEGYNNLMKVKTIEDFLTLVNPPTDEIKPVLLSMPSEFKVENPWKSASFPHDVYRWFRNEFYKLPGFLYDENWTAITFGIAPQYFSIYKDKLIEALFSGIWNDMSKPRWWRYQLINIATLGVEKSLNNRLQKSGQKSLKVHEDHFSKCEKCNEYWPEIMAFADETDDSNLYPYHRRCTQPHPNLMVTPYYEAPKMLFDE